MNFKKILYLLFKVRIHFICNNKIRRIYKILNIKKTLDKSIVNEHIRKWSILKKIVSPKWLEIYSHVSNKIDINYIPEDIYYTVVENTLNNSMFSLSYSDKNYYDKIDKNNLFPLTYFRCINGVFYDKNYKVIDKNKINSILNTIQSFILKPSIDSAGGKDINLFIRKNNIFINDNVEFNINILKNKYGNNFIVQEHISQNDYYKKFNPTSLNTVRIMTYRSVENEKIIRLHSVLRFGAPGSIVDNQASGGYSCGINKHGMLKNFYINKNGIKKELEINKNDFNVFKYKDMIKISKNIAQKFPYHRILGFDFCVDQKNKIRLIEVNTSSIEINFLQMNNGPLFRDYTNEVINYCNDNYRTICIDYYIK